VQKRAIKEVATDVENGNLSNGGENGTPKPRVVKKIPAHSVELEEEIVLDEKEVDLYVQEDQEES
ncbi:MAG: hypothetical protein KAS77_00430, partial [Thermoplasmata archaeon]|nr:hypothetical protein [Thermoplasmata archaeon]